MYIFFQDSSKIKYQDIKRVIEIVLFITKSGYITYFEKRNTAQKLSNV